MMMWQPVIATSLLLLGQVSAGVVGNGALLLRKDGTEQKMRRYVDSIVGPLERRQTMTSISNSTEWNGQTMAACTSALETLNGNAGNPSGMAACYNVPYLDNSTGVFQADLRLFTISAPSGSFASIPPQNVMVGLSYVGATVSAVNASSLKRRGDLVSLISWPRSVDGRKRQAAVPTMAQSYAFVGQINKNQLNTSMDTATLEKLLTPTVTLTGTDSNGQSVSTSLTGSEATFVNGVFAKAATTATKSTVQSPIQTLVVASNAPFVLPGIKILIVPIGGIITGVWAVLLMATIGYGTVGRMQFRDQFRRRSARATKGELARI